MDPSHDRIHICNHLTYAIEFHVTYKSTSSCLKNTSKRKISQMVEHFKIHLILKDLTAMLVTSWMMMVMIVIKMMVKTIWIVIGRYAVSWGLDLWVRLELMLLNYEMESVSAAYVVPYDYYKAFTSLPLWSTQFQKLDVMQPLITGRIFPQLRNVENNVDRSP
ncbi:hypothetical protein L1887_19520 [Cichorium endivia]|nr:hypothetical protein L1887_19520 [Cichorium endivia]